MTEQDIDRAAAIKALNEHEELHEEYLALDALGWMESQGFLEPYALVIKKLARVMQAKINEAINDEAAICRSMRLADEHEDRSFAHTHRAGPGGV